MNHGKKDVIGELIERVDNPVCGWKPLSIWKRILVNFINITNIIMWLFYLGVVAYAVYFLFPFVTKPEHILTIVIALTALVFQSGILLKQIFKPENREEMIRTVVEWNYERIRKGVESEHWLLLKALINLKTVQNDFRLFEVRKKCPSLFDEETLIHTLYDMRTLL